jgi:hypothetical protein
MGQHDDAHPLEPMLAEVENELQQALDEVCEDTHIGARDTDELIQIEETLAIAQDTAKQVISLRKRIRADEDRPSPPVS